MGAASAIRAGGAYVELMTRDSKLIKGLNKAQARLNAFGAGVTGLGTKIAGVGGVIVGGFLAAGKMFADMGSEIDDMSQRTGVSVEALSELGFAAEMSGSNMETLEKSLRKMQVNLVAAAGGSKGATDALKDVGLTVDQLANKSPDEQLAMIADGLSKIEGPGERVTAAIALLGKSGASLLPMLADGAEGLAKMRAEANRLGLTMDTEAAKKAALLGDSIDTLWKQAKKMAFEIGSAIVGDLQTFANNAMTVAGAIINWIKQNKALIATAFRVAVAVFAAGAALVAIGVGITMVASVIGGIITIIGALGAVFAAFGTAIAFLLSPIGLVVAAIVGLAGYFAYTSGTAGAAASFISGAFTSLVTDSKAAFGAIGAALAGGNIALAAEILWSLIKLEFTKGVNFLNSTWQSWKAFFLNVWSSASSSISRGWINTLSWIESAWVSTWDAVADVMTATWAWMKKGWNTTIGFIQKAWLNFKALFDSDINVAVESKKIDDATNQANSGADNQMSDRILGREDARKKRLAQIERDRAGAVGIVNDDQRSAEDKRLEAVNKAIREGEEKLARQKAEFAAAVDSGNATPSMLAEIGKAKLPTDDLAEKADNKINVAGTFSADAVSGLGASDTTERIAKAAEATAKNTKDTKDAIQSNTFDD